MPDGHQYEFFPKEEILTFEEITRVVKVSKSLGVRKVRITGGEPLLRRDIEKLISMISPFVEDVSLTTNGFLLKEKASSLKEAGLKRVTVSFHSLRDEVFSALVGRSVRVAHILEGIEEAIKVGLTPVKVNVCVVKGINDDEILSIAKFFKDMGVVVRFIEFMDVGNLNGWSLDKVVSAQEIVNTIAQHMKIRPIGRSYRGETALRYVYEDDGREFGVIASVTQPFCGDCNRLRLTADGKLLTCLFATDGHDIKKLLRMGASDEELAEFIVEVWQGRKDRYSEERLLLLQRGSVPRKVEMFKVGG